MRPPSAAEVIDGLHALGRFQQTLLELTDSKSNQELRDLAAVRAEDATRRDRTLKHILDTVGADPMTSNSVKPVSESVAETLISTADADGPAYVRSFYAAQITEFKKAIDLLERYLEDPDNPALSAFAGEHLAILKAQLGDVSQMVADRD